MDLIIGIVIGAVAGGAVVGLILLLRRSAGATELANARARAEMLDQQVSARESEIEALRRAQDAVEQEREQAKRDAAVLREKLDAERARLAEQKSLREEMEKRLSDTFDALSAKALRQSNQQFVEQASERFKHLLEQFKGEDEKTKQAVDSLVKPIRELLEKQNNTLSEIEKKRLEDKSGLQEQLKQIADAHRTLSSETGQLVKALRRPEQRGRWGELQLRNTVELAGMTERCDFDEQVTVWQGESAQRPDMVVRLPGAGGGVIPVDAKVAIDAYLDAIECNDNESRAECLRRHAAQIESHFRKLAHKQYWNGFERAPKIVVMFVPLESALIAALEVKPNLHADAMENHVLIATPTLLVALLRAVAYGWQQEAVAQNAREIAAAGKDLYDRLSTFVGHFEDVGKNLDRSAKSYNSAIGSLERNLLPGARRLKELHATTDGEINAPDAIDRDVREVVATELKMLPREERAPVN